MARSCASPVSGGRRTSFGNGDHGSFGAHGRFLKGKDVEIVDGNQIELKVRRAGFNPDSTFSRGAVHAISQLLRADEYVIGEVSTTPQGTRLGGELVLFRDRRLHQPLPTVIAQRLDSAAVLFAGAIAAARVQLDPQRRCENALRAGNRERAHKEFLIASL